MARERVRDLVEIFQENERRWKPRWRDLPNPRRGCYRGDVSLDVELIRNADYEPDELDDELDDTDDELDEESL